CLTNYADQLPTIASSRYEKGALMSSPRSLQDDTGGSYNKLSDDIVGTRSKSHRSSKAVLIYRQLRDLIERGLNPWPIITPVGGMHGNSHWYVGNITIGTRVSTPREIRNTVSQFVFSIRQ